jgi:hypothetical protein
MDIPRLGGLPGDRDNGRPNRISPDARSEIRAGGDGWTLIVLDDKLLGGDDALGVTPARPTILSHGRRVYSLDGGDSRVVTDGEDDVLQAFLEQEAMDFKTMAGKSGAQRPDRILRSLAQKFPGAIELPGSKAAGGYRVRIRRPS